MSRINAFLQMGREQNCSDIHFAVGAPPLMRQLGELVPIKYRDLNAAEVQDLLFEIMTNELKTQCLEGNDVDFSYHDLNLGRFRVNVFHKAGGLGAAFRVISSKIPTLDELDLPKVVEHMIQSNNGLVLVTGATGTGKSTTLAAMIENLNSNRRLNIITLEDPIEFIYESKMSLVVQREVGKHVDSFANGLRAALREDPDVILVGELRDPDTISLAMTAAETGHLVLGTLHTSSAVKSLDRIVDAMPSEQKAQTSTFLAQNLKGVISQKLIRTADGRSRKAIVEIMVNVPSIASLILGGKAHQIPSVLQTGSDKGMQLMDQALLDAINRKEIDPDDAYQHATDKKLFQQFVMNPDILPPIDLSVR
ncbi:MAG: type IV pilus twitching motility protein PilT [Gammaproteobacteria bacterium]|nr:type IV pilus twitching motility protein PilT [Gammaproteobacteria bacterium]